MLAEEVSRWATHVRVRRFNEDPGSETYRVGRWGRCNAGTLDAIFAWHRIGCEETSETPGDPDPAQTISLLHYSASAGRIRSMADRV